MYARGEGVARDAERARQLQQQACDGGSGRACATLGGLYARGEGVARDRKRARELYQRACDDGNRRGCVLLKGFKP
jgi:TPR repeat protein